MFKRLIATCALMLSLSLDPLPMGWRWDDGMEWAVCV